MLGHSVLALFVAAVCADPVAGNLEARRGRITATVTVSTCAKPSGAVPIVADSTSTVTIRAMPASFRVYDASTNSYAVASEQEESPVYFKPAHGSDFAIDTDVFVGALQLLDYGKTTKGGQPDYVGQVETGMHSWDPTIQHVHPDDLVGGNFAEAKAVSCRFKFGDDGSCPLACKAHGKESFICHKKYWEIWDDAADASIDDCKPVELYAVT